MQLTTNISRQIIDSYFESDQNFDEVYPPNIQKLAERHWTSVEIIKLAVPFLTNTGGKILDIGSGVGKFCLTGAHYAPSARFFGIEQRNHLVRCAQRAKNILNLENVEFIHGNFTQLDLSDFDHFYFYNSFYENLNEIGRIDEEIAYSEALFDYYTDYLYTQFKKMPSGTKIVAYHCFHGEIPSSYELVGSHLNGDLNFWEKI